MKHFKYCVWLTLPKDHPWNYQTNGFQPHITVKSELSLGDAVNLFKSIDFQSFNVTLSTLKQTYVDGFFALRYDVIPDMKPEWWPENAHVSFRYAYDTMLTDHLKSCPDIICQSAPVTGIQITECNGHYLNWKLIRATTLNNE